MFKIKQGILELALVTMQYASNNSLRSNDGVVKRVRSYLNEHNDDSSVECVLTESDVSEMLVCLRMYENHGHEMTGKAVQHIKSVTGFNK